MKSFSQFIIEKKGGGNIPLNPDEKAAERSIIKNFNKKNKNKDNRPFKDPQVSSDAEGLGDRQGRIDATDKKKGGYERVDDSFDDAKKTDGKSKLKNTTKGGEVKVTKPQGSLSSAEDRPLGRVVKRGIKKKGLELGDVDYTDAEDLANQRRARINPKTGKATQKGVENYAQSRGGYGRTTGKPRDMAPGEWSKRSRDAKNIAANPNSAAYKEIEAKINKSDYAGRRARGATPEEFKQIKSDIKNSKTINQKVNDAIDDVRFQKATY